jgi:hypothetical protein
MLGIDIGTLVDQLVDEAELAESGRPVESGEAILWWGERGGGTK